MHRLAQTLLLRKKRAGMARKYLPGLCHRHPAGMTVQQRHADLGLHLAQPLTGGRQGQMGIRRSAGDTAGIHDGDKQPQIGQIQSHHALLSLRFFRSLWPTYRIVALTTSCFNAPFYPEK